MVGSILRAFPEEFAAHLEGNCVTRATWSPPRSSTSPTAVTYDENHRRKRPDWTYRSSRDPRPDAE